MGNEERNEPAENPSLVTSEGRKAGAVMMGVGVSRTKPQRTDGRSYFWWRTQDESYMHTGLEDGEGMLT